MFFLSAVFSNTCFTVYYRLPVLLVKITDCLYLLMKITQSLCLSVNIALFAVPFSE